MDGIDGGQLFWSAILLKALDHAHMLVQLLPANFEDLALKLNQHGTNPIVSVLIHFQSPIFNIGQVLFF